MEEDNKISVESEKKENFLNKKKQVKGKPLKIWIIVIVIIFMLFTFGAGLALGKNLYGKDNKKETTKENQEQTNVKKELKDSNVINKLEKFVKVASYDNTMGYGKAEIFMLGISNLSKDLKLYLAYESLIPIGKAQTKIAEVPEKYKDDIHFNAGETEEVTISAFDDEYKSLFNESPKYEDNEIEGIGCPMFYKVDRELGKIFIGAECGGTGEPEKYYKIYKYEEDDNYYYVSQYVGTEDPLANTLTKIKSHEVVDVPSFEGNEDKFETVIWRFDKNLNFISTENIG